MKELETRTGVMAPAKRATIKEVARLAGVSPITTARVFNGRYPVAGHTKKRVLQAANSLSYKRNPMAAGLKGGKTHSLALLWSMGIPMIPSDVFQRLADNSKNSGYNLQLVSVRNALDDVDQSHISGIDGIILCTDADNIDEKVASLLRRFAAAVVVVNAAPKCVIDHILWDRNAAIREVVRYFKSTGRARPCYLLNVASNKLKADTFLSAAWECGFKLEGSPFIDVAGDLQEDSATFLEEYVTSGRFNHDAVLCLSDEYAIFLKRILLQKGIRVPDDVAVVGFNNTISAILEPDLATVDRCHGILAEEISRMVFARLKNPGLPVQRVNVSMQFIRRKSAG
jgi:DNA-binding LacI/PurR family transcriptional regulator